MKKRIIIVGIILMAIGFAAISTTLIINGAVNIVGDQDSFSGDVRFSKAKPEDGGTAKIIENGKKIEYKSKKLETLHDTAKLEFEISNYSRIYDADVKINCTVNDESEGLKGYVTIRPNQDKYLIAAGNRKEDYITITLIKAYTGETEQEIKFTCTLVAEAKEREQIGEKLKDKLTDFRDMKRLASKDEDVCGEYGIVEVSHEDATIASLSEYGNAEAQANAVANLKQTEYRYCGGNPDNYVTFNGEKAGWRIIGLVNTPEGQRIKLIRTTYVNTAIAWNSKSGNPNDWPNSSLKEYLTETYYETLGADTNFLDMDVTWNLGGVGIDYDIIAVKDWYSYERGATVYTGRSKIWNNGNGIGLMYPSDYGYATNGGALGRETCLELYFNNSSSNSWRQSENYQCSGKNQVTATNWLFDSNTTQWLLNSRSDYSNNVYYVDTAGIVYGNGVASNTFAVRPVVYLKPEVTISGGEGTQEEPYELKLES